MVLCQIYECVARNKLLNELLFSCKGVGFCGIAKVMKLDDQPCEPPVYEPDMRVPLHPALPATKSLI